ncbi:helix-turn-helix domain-containing protein [Parapedobacter sp. DT-150]|uniref:helix-turn-helix domain-containing protein n=1 Tax=Parapedobacter sp. DT-150 TaxID=3396162 RepID=UPI003F1C4F08
MNAAFQEDKVHEGHNVKRIREIIGLKQSALGDLCPGKYSQQRISDFESMIQIDEPIMEELAAALGVTPEFVRNFSEEKAIYNIQNNRDTASQNANYVHTANYHPADQIISLLEKFIEEDKAKTESIATLSKAVLDLAEEVKKLKGGK